VRIAFRQGGVESDRSLRLQEKLREKLGSDRIFTYKRIASATKKHTCKNTGVLRIPSCNGSD
jgi:hypothetical protein